MRRLYVVAATAILAAVTGPQAHAVTFTQSGQFVTTNQGMWGANNQLRFSEEYTLVDTGQLGISADTFVHIDNSAAVAVYDHSLRLCSEFAQYFGSSLNCKTAKIPGLGHGPSKPSEPEWLRPDLWLAYYAEKGAYETALAGCDVFYSLNHCKNGISPVGDRPPATLKDGIGVNVSNARLKVGLGVDIEVGAGKVNAKQKFEADITISNTAAKAGDIVNIATAGRNQEASISSSFDAVKIDVSQFVDVDVEIDAEQYILGSKVLDESLLDINTGKNSHKVLDLSVGQGDVSANIVGVGGGIDLTEGIPYNLTVPITPGSPIQIPIGDVTGYIPDLDVPATSGTPGEEVDVSVQPQSRTGLGSGETRNDIARVDLDIDSISALKGLPLGYQVGVSPLFTINMDMFDLDIGAFFGATQTQSFEGGEIAVRLVFSVPVMVETFPGSGDYELLSEKIVKLGDALNLIHPGGDFSIDPEYILVDNEYENLFQFIVDDAIDLKAFLVSFGGIFGHLSGNEPFGLLEATLGFDGWEDLGAPAYSETVSLDGFAPIQGQSIVLDEAAPSTSGNPSTVPLPPSAIMLGALVLAVPAIRARRRVYGS